MDDFLEFGRGVAQLVARPEGSGRSYGRLSEIWLGRGAAGSASRGIGKVL